MSGSASYLYNLLHNTYLSKSEGLHHLADLGEDFIWWPLSINLWMESKVSVKSMCWVRAPRAQEARSAGQNTNSPVILFVLMQVVKISWRHQTCSNLCCVIKVCFQLIPLYWAEPLFSLHRRYYASFKKWQISGILKLKKLPDENESLLINLYGIWRWVTTASL